MIEYWFIVTDHSEYRQRRVSRLCSILVRLNCGVVGEIHVNDSCCWYLIRRSIQGTRLRSVPDIDYRWTLVYLLRTTEVIRSNHLSVVLVVFFYESRCSSHHRVRRIAIASSVHWFVQSYYRSQVTSSTVDCDCLIKSVFPFLLFRSHCQIYKRGIILLCLILLCCERTQFVCDYSLQLNRLYFCINIVSRSISFFV